MSCECLWDYLQRQHVDWHLSWCCPIASWCLVNPHYKTPFGIDVEVGRYMWCCCSRRGKPATESPV